MEGKHTIHCVIRLYPISLTTLNAIWNLHDILSCCGLKDERSVESFIEINRISLIKRNIKLTTSKLLMSLDEDTQYGYMLKAIQLFFSKEADCLDIQDCKTPLFN